MKRLFKFNVLTAVLCTVLLVGTLGNAMSVSAAESYNTVTLSTSWKTIASSTTGFNCNVTISAMATGTDGLGIIRPDIRMLDNNGSVVWSESKSCPGYGTRTYSCGSNVYKIQIKVANGAGTAYAYRS